MQTFTAPIARRKSTIGRLVLAIFTTALLAAAFSATSANAATKNVIAVGNASGGTVSFLDATTYNNLGSINVTPDLAWRKTVIFLNPITLVGWEVVKGQKGGERIVDDVALSPDGKKLYVSRGMLMDTAAFDLKTKKMLWRRDVGSFNSDHMAISPDGKKLVVSATTAKKSQVIDTATGNIVDSFETGDYPHENTFSADGTKVYNASIGTTALPYELNDLKGAKQLTVVDSTNFNLIKKFTFEHGIRPNVITSDDQTMFTQFSYTRGFAEVNLNTGQVVRRAAQASTPQGDALFWDNLPSNSAHHGLAMNGAGDKFCNAGTIDNYVTIVRRSNFTTQSTVSGLQKPYWAVTSLNGNDCLVSNSDGDFVSVVNYASGAEVKRVNVGDYPQRERLGKLDTTVSLSSSAG